MRWRLSKLVGLGMFAWFSCTPGLAEPAYHQLPITYRDGLPYVSVGLLGCTLYPEVELLLDSGASTTVLSPHHARALSVNFRALETGRERVELASFELAQTQALLIDGLVLGGCELPGVRVSTAPDTTFSLKPVLGMNVLSRLENVRIELGPNEAHVIFRCPDPPHTDAPCDEEGQ